MRLRILLCAVLVLALSVAAHANTIDLSAINGNLYQQAVQSPCIFSNSSCQNGSFPATSLPNGGNVTSYDALSPVYTGAQILALLMGGPLQIGIDINQANTPQTLTSFTMSKNGVVVDTFTGSTGNVPKVNNGNGFADYLLNNFSSFTSTDTIQFHFVFNDANDGTENVFIAPLNPLVITAEPSSLLLTASGLFLLAFPLYSSIRRTSVEKG